ncbi:MAG: hypothetical protein QXX35_03185 [Desulfurococcaceae archaeon]|uniref:Uncharacterized protein n=1 Tax=Staphylothermus marinus TaxID=2280 RepID=A0A7C4HA62_STAMA
MSSRQLFEIIKRFISSARYRYGDVFVEKISIRKSKYIVYMRIMNNRVKVIVNKRRVNVRVYCGLKGLEIAVRRMFTREYVKVVKR